MHKDLYLLQIVKIISEYRNPAWNIAIVQSKNTDSPSSWFHVGVTVTINIPLLKNSLLSAQRC